MFSPSFHLCRGLAQLPETTRIRPQNYNKPQGFLPSRSAAVFNVYQAHQPTGIQGQPGGVQPPRPRDCCFSAFQTSDETNPNQFYAGEFKQGVKCANRQRTSSIILIWSGWQSVHPAGVLAKAHRFTIQRFLSTGDNFAHLLFSGWVKNAETGRDMAYLFGLSICWQWTDRNHEHPHMTLHASMMGGNKPSVREKHVV